MERKSKREVERSVEKKEIEGGVSLREFDCSSRGVDCDDQGTSGLIRQKLVVIVWLSACLCEGEWQRAEQGRYRGN